MNDFSNYLIIILAISNSAFITLYLREKEKKVPPRPGSTELSEFISDLVNGNGLVMVTRVAPTDILIRSPRHARN